MAGYDEDRSTTEIRKAHRLLRSTAYQMAAMQLRAEEAGDKLFGHIRDMYPKASDPIAESMRQSFLDWDDIDGSDLVKRIRDGLTRAEYLAESPPVYTGKPAKD